MKLYGIKRTTYACPSQWEGTTEDDRPVYIRYRGSIFEIRIGPVNGTIDDAVNAETVYERSVGDEFDGYMSSDDMFVHWLQYREQTEREKGKRGEDDE